MNFRNVEVNVDEMRISEWPDLKIDQSTKKDVLERQTQIGIDDLPTSEGVTRG